MMLLLAFAMALTAVATPALCQEVSVRRVNRIVYGPSPADHFSRPRGLVVDRSKGIIAIGDSGGHRLAYFDSLGRYRGALPWPNDATGRPLSEPRSVSIDSRGRIFVLDLTGQEIQVLSPAGTRLGRFDLPLPPEFAGATGAAIQVGASGRIHVLLGGTRHGVAVIEADGRSARVIDFADVDGGSFVSPTAFAVDPTERVIAILDQRATLQVKVISIDGELLNSFGPHNEGPGGFSMPISAVWGPQATLWIVDTVRHAIRVFDSAGRFVGSVGSFGRGPGQLNYPSACAFLTETQLVTLERAGGRFQILDLEHRFLEYSHGARDVGLRDMEPLFLALRGR